jgi:5-methylcytosine-specific restriction endonuclease McrA
MMNKLCNIKLQKVRVVMAIKKSDREKIYKKYNGRCAYCGKEIDIHQMQVDHIIAKRNGGEDTFENYNPACRNCNHYKRGGGIEYLRIMLKTLHERIQQQYIVKIGIDYGIVELKPFDGKFYFEKIKE